VISLGSHCIIHLPAEHAIAAGLHQISDASSDQPRRSRPAGRLMSAVSQLMSSSLSPSCRPVGGPGLRHRHPGRARLRGHQRGPHRHQRARRRQGRHRPRCVSWLIASSLFEYCTSASTASRHNGRRGCCGRRLSNDGSLRVRTTNSASPRAGAQPHPGNHSLHRCVPATAAWWFQKGNVVRTEATLNLDANTKVWGA